LSPKILFVYLNCNGIRRIPLGISILASALKNAGYTNIELFDTTFYKRMDEENERREKLKIVKKAFEPSPYMHFERGEIGKDFRRVVNKFNPDIIAISLLQDEWNLAKKIISGIKEYSNAFVIAGGVMPTLAPELVLKYLDIDAVMIGECEDALVELVSKVNSNQNPYTASNIAYYSGEKLIINTLAPLAKLTELPPHDYTIFDEEHLWKPFIGKYWKTGYVELTRGCPFNCTFCANTRINALYDKRNSRIRSRNIDTFIDEVKNLKESYGLELFAFNDENFLFLKDLAYFTKKWKNSINLPFLIQTRVETIALEKLKLLKDAGCITISIGIESGDEEFRKIMLKRKYSNKDVKRAFYLCKKAGIRSTANNMIGFPNETEKHMIKTINLNRECKPDSITNAIFTPYLGCELYDVCLRDGLMDGNFYDSHIPFYESCLKFTEEHKKIIYYYFENFQKMVFSDKEINEEKHQTVNI
jgi:radical SAM superfamily enzyme YgiQ (UPF0313 family)